MENNLGPKGICPNCKDEIQGILYKKGTIGRNTYQCPNCNHKILICFNPSCNDYAEYGTIINNDFCPACTGEIIKTTTGIGVSILGVVLSAIVTKNLIVKNVSP